MKIHHLFITLVAILFTLNVSSQCTNISLIGEFSDWAADSLMVQDEENPDLWSLVITFTEEDDIDESGFVDMKFRANQDWGTNWGNDDFPSGIGEPGGANVPVPYGTYLVTFNCDTKAYNFSDYVGLHDDYFKVSKLYPNPVINTLNITNTSQFTNVEIFSISGQLMVSIGNLDQETINISISDFKPGIYFLKIQTLGSLMFNRKFIKK